MDDPGSGWHVWVGRIQMRSIDDPGEAPRLQPGGTLSCYVLASSRDDALMEIVGEVTNNEYELLEMEWLDPVTPDGWPHAWDEEDARLYELAVQSEQVVFGVPDAWDDED